MSYIEGFIIPVPQKNKQVYLEQAASAAPLFHQFGVRRMVETWGDDVPDGKVTDFRRAVQAAADEDVLFSWFEYPDRAARDAANVHFRNDPRVKEMMASMSFDGRRLVCGGFATINDQGTASRPGYVDGCVLAVPTDKKDDYTRKAIEVSKVFREYGATRIVDAWADDVPDGKVTDFKGAVARKDDEQVVYSWVEWPSKEVRDAGWAKAMQDPRIRECEMPFDGKRMIYGGFRTILDEEVTL